MTDTLIDTQIRINTGESPLTAEDEEIYNKLEQFFRLSPYSVESENKKAAIQQEIGGKTFPILVRLAKEGKVNPFHALNLIRGIEASNEQLFEVHKSFALMDKVFKHHDGSAFSNALDGIVAFGGVESESALEDVRKAIFATEEVSRRDDYLGRIDRYETYIGTEGDHHFFLLGFRDEREKSKLIYELTFEEYSRRLREEAGSIETESEDDLDLGDSYPRSYERPKFFSYESNGVSVVIYPLQTVQKYFVNGEPLEIDKGELIASISFMPSNSIEFQGIQSYTREGKPVLEGIKTIEVLTEAYLGMKNFLDRVYNSEDYPPRQRLPYVNFIIGYTNRRMALLAQRFGFKVVDEDRLPEGKKRSEINMDEPGVTIIARIRDIKEASEKYENSKKGRTFTAGLQRRSLI